MEDKPCKDHPDAPHGFECGRWAEPVDKQTERLIIDADIKAKLHVWEKAYQAIDTLLREKNGGGA